MLSVDTNGSRVKKRARGAMIIGIVASMLLSACSGRTQESFISIEQFISCIKIDKADNGVVNVEISGPFIVSTEGFNSNVVADVKRDGSIYVCVSSNRETNVTIIKPGGKTEDEFRIRFSPEELLIFSQNSVKPILRYDISKVVGDFTIPLTEAQKSNVKK